MIPGYRGDDQYLEKFHRCTHTFKSLKICSLDETFDSIEIEGGRKDGSSITFLCGSVDNADVCKLWKASEREAMATGDQSLSEAISANKNFVYEALAFKDILLRDLKDKYGLR